MLIQPDLNTSSKPSMTNLDSFETDDLITFTGIPEVNISVPDRKQIALDKLRFSVQELISESSEPYNSENNYLTVEEIKSAINKAFEEEVEWRSEQLNLINGVKDLFKSFVF